MKGSGTFEESLLDEDELSELLDLERGSAIIRGESDIEEFKQNNNNKGLLMQINT